MKKELLLSLVLVVFLFGCQYMVPGSESLCEPPAIAMTDINGNTVCVLGDHTNGTEDEMLPLSNTTSQSTTPVTEAEEDESNQTAADLLGEMREDAGIEANTTHGAPSANQVVCAQDVKTCPDGSFVSRIPPECAFPACPGLQAEPRTETEQDSIPADMPRKTVTAGERVSFPNLVAYDPEGDSLTYTFSTPLDENGEWQTESGDEGEYIVEIHVSDGVNVVTQKVLVIVEGVNEAPQIAALSDRIVREGDVVIVTPAVSDPDGDDVAVTFSEPIGADGNWQTSLGDAGEYKVEVYATDGTLTDTASFVLTVIPKNRAPVIQEIADLTVSEGETISLNPVISDPEGDTLTVTYSGWMDSETYTTTYDDAGVHLVTVTASDGVNEVSEQITVTVKEVNRPPVFSADSFT